MVDGSYRGLTRIEAPDPPGEGMERNADFAKAYVYGSKVKYNGETKSAGTDQSRGGR